MNKSVFQAAYISARTTHNNITVGICILKNNLEYLLLNLNTTAHSRLCSPSPQRKPIYAHHSALQHYWYLTLTALQLFQLINLSIIIWMGLTCACPNANNSII